VLRWKEGTFTGQSMVIIAFGAVVYSISKAVIEVVLAELGGGDYALEFTTVSGTWGVPIFVLLVYYVLRTAVESVTSEAGDDGSNRFWGI
jgi:hypothetical protein